MGLILKLFLSHAGAFMVGGLVLAGVIYVEGLRLEVSHDKRVIAADTAEIKTLGADIGRQNAATEAVAAEGRRTQAAAAKALQHAYLGRNAMEKELASLRAAKPGVDQCQSADQLILQSLSH